MQAAVRTQGDDRQDEYSLAAGLDLSGQRDMTRQEYRDEANINILLARFGVGAPFPQKPTVFNVIDYNIDLQTALGAIRDVKAVWQEMPAEVRARYRTWQELLNAVDSGRLKLINEEAPSETPNPA